MGSYILYGIYTILLITRVLAPQINSLAIVLLICINIFVYVTYKKYRKIALFSSFLMPGEIFPIVNYIIGLLFIANTAKSMRIYKANRINILLLCTILTTSFINSIVYGTVPNFFFSIVYLGFVVLSIRMSEGIIAPSDIVKCMKNYVVIEFIITLSIVFKYRLFIPGDEFSGSMSSAHWLGNWLIVALVLFAFHDERTSKIKLSYRSIKHNIIYILMTLIMIYLADAKSLLIALAIGGFGFFFFEKRRSYKYSFMFFTIVFCSSLFVLFALLYSPFVREFITTKNSLLATYLYNEGWNGKFQYIRGTLLNELPGLRIFTGFGLGQYGSRVANLFAYDTMWRADNSINNLIARFFESRCIPQYSQYIKFYSADFVSQIGWRSAVMSYPFNSITALIAETGIVGVLFFARYFNGYVKNSECKLLAYYFVIACFFDLYFDNFPCVGIIILILMNTKKMNMKGRN